MAALLEFRWHGRGGQGAVTASALLAEAALQEGHCSQSFPYFGPERRGAPVMAYTRLSDRDIRNRSEVYAPDVVVVLDETLLSGGVNAAQGLKPEGWLIVNTKASPERVAERLSLKNRIATVDATRIAMDELGAPIVNTAILGALVQALGTVKAESVATALASRFGMAQAQRNIKAMQRAMGATQVSAG